MTKLILVRHGHVEGISPERLRGRAELPLTELGRREAQITATWQGLTTDEARARSPDELDTWYRHPDWAAIPRGETLQQVLTRAVAALREVIRHHPDDTIVLVAHDSVNRVLLLHALELPLSRYWRFKQNPCCINELDLSADGFTILGINQTDHLRQAK